MRWRVSPRASFWRRKGKEMTNGIIVINSGSTSLKFGAYRPDEG
ncbi:MAG: hypothetical protein GTO41_23835, partial [Burkholderiales bacterium]|nr:hypothetical protein [Burkholderiales bacterium]